MQENISEDVNFALYQAPEIVCTKILKILHRDNVDEFIKKLEVCNQTELVYCILLEFLESGLWKRTGSSLVQKKIRILSTATVDEYI